MKRTATCAPAHVGRTGQLAGLALLALGATMAGAAETGIDAPHSTVVATFKQEGVPVDAPFHQFSGRIGYDPAHPELTTATFDLTTASIDVGNPAYSSELAKPAWFDSAHYALATFRSTAARAGLPGHIEVSGTLTLKGRSVAISVPIAVVASGAQLAFDGSYTLSRKAFGIGDADWQSVLDDKVVVRFHLLGAAR